MEKRTLQNSFPTLDKNHWLKSLDTDSLNQPIKPSFLAIEWDKVFIKVWGQVDILQREDIGL